MNFKGKLAVVTGAARGIGREIALQLAGHGADIAVVDLKAEMCDETVGLVKELDRKAVAYGCNVADSSEVNSTVNAVLKDFEKIDFLVNNAGITKDNLLMRMSDDEWDAVIAVNLKGVFNFTRAVARPMMKMKAGKIVNIASVVGITGNAGQANYSSSKAGVIGLTKTTAQELASRGINVNAVAPGFIQTDMTDKLPDSAKEKIMSQVPFGRMGKPLDVAGAVLFLCSSLSDYVTGHTVVVAGGMGM